MTPLAAMKRWAKALKRDVLALWLAARDPRVPWRAKLVAGAVAAYAFSPIDLIPDFIPVLGYLDDLVLVPLGVLLAIRLVPGQLMAEFRTAAARHALRPVSRIGLAVILAIWLACIILMVWALRDLFTAQLSSQASGALPMKPQLAAIIFLGATFGATFASTAPAAAASFDCERSDLAADEKAICDTRSLNDADVKMVTTFDILTTLLPMGNRDKLKEDQSAWLKKRQDCGADAQCLADAYAERMKELDEAYNGLSRPL
jgi:uncharacterized membrane protein YkvA (DUF1232 family)/uncharacterized protein YecT (DUF1311 family)